jgi:hypothetical protein
MEDLKVSQRNEQELPWNKIMMMSQDTVTNLTKRILRVANASKQNYQEVTWS